MEILNMMGHPVVRLWLAQAMVVFFLVSGVTLLAFGVSLIVNSAGALRLIAVMNRWVSMREVTKPLEVLRDTRHVVQKYRHVFAAIFVLGGAYAIYGLLTQFSTEATIRLLGLNAFSRDAALWLAESLHWLLIVGNLFAIIVGFMLALLPGYVAALEARAGRWVSLRRLTKGADNMNIKLDSWVAVYPRAIGAIIVVVALVLIGIFGMMVPRIW